MIFCIDDTAAGRTKLVAGPPCEVDGFEERAQLIVERFQMAIEEKIEGLDVIMWITSIGSDFFCISWDIWLAEVSVATWKETPDEKLKQLIL